jgi:tetratricopeptide (TPR) repeat protein
VGVLGEGGGGIVYKARDPGDPARFLAIKVLRPGATSEEARGRFERERALATELGIDKGFVPLLASGKSDRGPYYVMPFLAGGDLRDRIKRGVLGVEETVALGVALARAIGRAHERGIVHRDLKPENIFFTEQGRPLIADLGLGKRIGPGAAASLTATNEVLGTPLYMAPEQAQGMKNAGPAVDVFALGAVLHECLSGAPPFEGDTFLEIVGRTVRGDFPRIASLRSDVPARVAQVIERCLVADPAARPRDGHALANELEAARRSVRRGPVLAILVLFVAMAAVALATWVPRTAPPARGVETPPRPAAPSLAAEDALAAGEPERAIAIATSALAVAPRDPRLLAVRGQAHVLRLENDAALAHAEQALEVDPRNAWALAVRSGAHLAIDRKTARADADRAFALDPDSPWVLLARARVLETDGPGHGRASADRAVQLAPRMVWAWVVHMQMGDGTADGSSATEDAERALRLAPRSSIALVARGELKLGRADFKGSHADLDLALELEPDSLLVLRAHADLERREGNVDAAQADIDHALGIAPRHPQILEQRAALFLRRGDDAGAVKAFEDLLQVWPDSGGAHAFLGLALQRLGQLDRALEEETRAIELSELSAWPWSNRASIRLQQKDVQGAIEDATHSLELDPTYREALWARAQAYAAHGDFGLAAKDLGQFRDELPRGPEGDAARVHVDQLLKSLEARNARTTPR